MLIQLISVKQGKISLFKRQKDTIENVEIVQIISYKTSLLGVKNWVQNQHFQILHQKVML